MTNQDIARALYEIADLLDILSVEWKPIAFRKAARIIESLPEDVEKKFRKEGEKGLLEIEGVGKGIAMKIAQFIEEGKIDELEELRKKIPAGVEAMLRVPGLGPKKVARLFNELKIDSVEKLGKMAREEKIRTLEGFGEKSEEDILMGIGLVQKGSERKLTGIIAPFANDVLREVRALPFVEKAELAGSFRRRRETVKDLDLLVFTKKPKEVSKEIAKLSHVKDMIKSGEKMTSVRFENGMSSDMRILPMELYGSGMLHFTGSKEHGIAIRNRAIGKGMKFSEYGLLKGNKIVASKTEEDVYEKLGLRWIPPELREDKGEIEASEKGKLPALVEESDVKGDVHMHTVWSDGANTSEEMIQVAIAKKYEYIAITDHSKSDRVANGMDEKRLKQHIVELEKLQKKYPKIKILAGAEVAILGDGKMDYSNETLKELDVVIGSIHSGFKNDEKKITGRIVSALENEYVHFIAHPTGRLINQRNPYAVNMEKVMEEAKRNGKALEVNAHPSRLDLNAEHVRMAVERGVKLVINTDAHSTSNLDFMEWGVAQARRGWAEKKDILNTQPWKAFQKFLK
ncbi:MAG: DNA polymerase/3'-5' exonuclease PolX [archaeon]